MKKAICVGINDYPGTVNDLHGCVNDANDWTELLKSEGFDVTKILDSSATKNKILSTLENALVNSKNGDTTVFTYSGHGTQVRDTSGDEEDGYDEALYVYDSPIIDDDLRKVLDKTPNGVKVFVFMDSCFSGTVTREWEDDLDAITKFVYPEDYDPNLKVKTKLFGKARMTTEEMPEVLLTGCSDKEYSYDAYINNRYNGAATYYTLESLKQNLDNTFKGFYKILRTMLPSNDYPQTPQLEGSTKNLNTKLFGEESPAPEPTPDPEPQPQPDPTPTPIPEPPPDILDCIRKILEWLLSLFKKN